MTRIPLIALAFATVASGAASFASDRSTDKRCAEIAAPDQPSSAIEGETLAVCDAKED